jgi:bifunctional non-homologous end joining protein LigD
MLATLGTPPTGEGWAFEMKWDGQRIVADIDNGTTLLYTRNVNEVAASYPDLTAAIAEALGDRSAILDGEIVALDASGVPSFKRLQRRMHVLTPATALLREVPVSLYVFDVLAINGGDTTRLPYLRRRELLEDLDLSTPTVATPPFWTGTDGPAMLDTARKHGLEGIVAKKIASLYLPGRRSPSWIKTPLRNNTEVVVCGWIPGQGAASGGIGSLLLGAHNSDRELVYIGHVGTGFTAKARRELLAQLQPLEQSDPPFDTTAPRSLTKGAHWVTPTLVGDVEYLEFTDRLRHPAWKGLRDDKGPNDVDWPGTH